MCGICGGVWTTRDREIRSNVLDRATDAMSRRGPDDRGAVRIPLRKDAPVEEAGLALGHRRLAIIDLSNAGRQPFANDAKTVWLTFNGEIYNYVELRAELEARGRRFRTKTDVEVLLQAYEEYGLDCLAKFDGMFAFAIWDVKERRLLLARDRIGKKPLVYRMERDRLLFASELKSLLQFDRVPRELDLIALREYLTYQYVPYPRTIYRGIAKLPPASYLLWREGETPVLERYWRAEELADFDGDRIADSALDALRESGAYGAARLEPNGARTDLGSLSFDELAQELRRRLEDAVRIRMRSDAPFGAFLSGGVDSTIVAGMMRKFSSTKIRTFSIGFAERDYDETPFARRTAERFGTDHTEFFVEPNAKEIMPDLVDYFDEPFADSSAIPTWYLCQTTRKEVTVALGGDGGDELFAGYDRYKAVELSKFVMRAPAPIRKFLAGPVRAILPNSIRQRSPWRRAKRFLETIGMDAVEQYLQWIAIYNRSRLDALLSDEYWEEARRQEDALRYEGARPNADEIDCVDFLSDAIGKFNRRDPTSTISFADVLTYLPCDIMTKVDMASMRWSLETRSPLLDPNVVELALVAPLRYKLRGRVGKRLLRAACVDLLPNEIDARPKTGFGVPLDVWFRGELNGMLKEALFDASSERSSNWFDRDYVSRLVREHEEGRFDHAARLWSLFVFRLWEARQ
ncbi:MAG: asparagine synthase (glutamine-hydrolyzing) [Thermoguttaceae bacterium]|nr:asparagine synthase (glutamine-hydrolyzing) [Thermoguttaceae bacterium]